METVTQQETCCIAPVSQRTTLLDIGCLCPEVTHSALQKRFRSNLSLIVCSCRKRWLVECRGRPRAWLGDAPVPWLPAEYVPAHDSQSCCRSRTGPVSLQAGGILCSTS